MIATPQPPNMTIAEYLEWELLQELRYEYVHGTVIAMTGGTIPPNDITLNLYRVLYPQVRLRGCRINVADVKVEVSSNSPYYYPDVVVIESIDFSFPIALLYENVSFGEES